MNIEKATIIEEDTSMNRIYNEFISMYNYLKKEKSGNIVENFILPHQIHQEEISILFIMMQLFGYPILFTIEELQNTILFFELKASELTKEQRTNRKKVLTNIQTLLVKLNNSGDLLKLINIYVEDKINKAKERIKDITLTIEKNKERIENTNDDNYKKQLEDELIIFIASETSKQLEDEKEIESLKPNILSSFKLLQNTIELFLKEINDIENDKYFYIQIAILVLLVLLVLFIIAGIYYSTRKQRK
jgi:hypothetical protein